MEATQTQSLIHCRTVGDRSNLEPLLAEIAQQQFAQAVVVVDDKDTLRGIHGSMIIRTVAMTVKNCGQNIALKQIITKQPPMNTRRLHFLARMPATSQQMALTEKHNLEIHMNTTHKILGTLIGITFTALIGGNALADETNSSADTPAKSQMQRMEHMKNMTPEERAEERKKMRQEWDSMTPEQRAERRKEMRKKFAGMPPEERRAMRKEMRDAMDDMTPEERAQHRKERHEKFEKMSPEERRAMRKEMRDEMKNMSPEERAHHRKERRGHDE